MARLSELNDPSAVEAALAEFRALGRQGFLDRYGFKESKDYFVRDKEGLVDTKPLVAAAMAIQHPERPRLTTDDFSGGLAGANRALTRLGFEVVTRAQLSPPKLGDQYANRTEIYDAYGGDKVTGIIRFPGEATVNVFSDATGPYADELPTLTEPFGYRGAGLNGDQKINWGGNALLENARATRTPVRFWYKPVGEPFTFLCWAVVIGRAWVQGTGDDKRPRAEIEWRIAPVTSPETEEWPADVLEAAVESEATVENSPDVPEARQDASYVDLVNRLESLPEPDGPKTVIRVNPQRHHAAKRAVLMRSGGRCESPWCTGMPPENNRRGEPILDVDHIKDLALGGADHPLNMVALCPNCHAAKTRGSNVRRWRTELGRIAADAHRQSLTTSPSGMGTKGR